MLNLLWKIQNPKNRVLLELPDKENLKEKTLIIVESPKKAKSISKYLGKDYLVIASYGHVFDLNTSSKFPLGINLRNNFELRWNVLPNKVDVLKSILSSAQQASEILLASDYDREGESIAWHLQRALESTGKPISRIVFKEITEKEIKKSIKNPTSVDVNLCSSQQARRAVDRIVGFLVSGFLRDQKDGSSAGRVQSVALKMIVDLEKEITDFIPKKYWTINALLNKDNTDFEIKYHKTIDTLEQSNKILESLQKEPLVISSVKKEKKNKPAKPPFTTLTLVSSAHSELKLSAAETMKLAQSLYEDGLITYMRTDSVRTSEDAIKVARDYLKDNNFELPKMSNKFETKSEAQDAHEAIRPTDVNLEPDSAFIPSDQKKLYALIWKRFLASQLKPAVYNTVSIEFLNKSKHLFKVSGKSLESPGWLKMMHEDDGKDVLLPALEMNEIFMANKPKSQEKQTQPPSRYNERTLVEDLEKKGIGRPSTYHTIIPKLEERGYILEKSKTLSPTITGIKIIHKLKDYFSFMKYDYTAQMEKQLDLIAEGKLSYLEMLTQFYSHFSNELKFAYVKSENSGEVCKKCGSPANKFNSLGVTYIHCYKYPECNYKFRYQEGQDANIQLDEPFQPCRKCGFFTHQIVSEKYGNYNACARFPHCL